jgi:hypothetical protein
MATPEGHVKATVRKLLNGYPGLFQYWPVPSGYGQTTLDILGCYRGQFFCIETKAPKKKPTLRQTGLLNDIERAMGKTFVISGADSPVLDELRAWLDNITETIDDHPHISPDQVSRRPIP